MHYLIKLHSRHFIPFLNFQKKLIHKMTKNLLAGLFAFVSLSLVVSYNDLVIHDITTQPWCREVIRPRTLKCEWKIGLYRNIDNLMLKGTIAAYQIRWFSGGWSGWFVPGFNDLDGKFNPYRVSCGSFPKKSNTMRRMWSYFYDHTHKYILCQQRKTLSSLYNNIRSVLLSKWIQIYAQCMNYICFQDPSFLLCFLDIYSILIIKLFKI